MMRRPLDSVLHFLHRVTTRATDQTDAQLVARFLHERDESAFAGLLERHGGLVWGVCCRLLRSPADREDVFQATFLVLFRRLAELEHSRPLGSWLYGVAYRIALKARTRAARSRLTTVAELDSVDTAADHPAAIEQDELTRLLDEQLHSLPTRYRDPLVLCYLQGKSTAEAARLLGWPAGSMSRHLRRGRELLRERLVQRGVELTGAALVACLAQQAAAAPPTRLLADMRGLARLHSLGAAALEEATPSRARALADGCARSLGYARLKLIGAIMLLLATLGAGLVLAEVDKQAPVLKVQPAVQPELAVSLGNWRKQSEVEAAVKRGLLWIERQQEAAGNWKFANLGNNQQTSYDVAATGLALLPFLANGESHRGNGPHAKTIDKGLRYLVSKQGKDGQFDNMLYVHSVALLAMCEAYALSKDPALRGPAQKGIDFSVAAQGKDGGWRYRFADPGDTPSTCWQLQALEAARKAGLNVPAKTLQRAALFLDGMVSKDGRYGYANNQSGSTWRTAAALRCRPGLGWKELERFTIGFGHFDNEQPGLSQAQFSSYYIFHLGGLTNQLGVDVRYWNRNAQFVLLHKQVVTKDERNGMWAAQGDSVSVDPLMSTSLSLLSLLAKPQRPTVEKRPLDDKELQQCWQDLAGQDSLRAELALRALAGCPEKSVPFLAEHLKPAQPIDRARLLELIAKLDDEDFAVRQNAEIELSNMPVLPRGEFEKAMKKGSLEVRARLRRLLAKKEGALVAEDLQAFRGLSALWYIGTPEAVAVLKRFDKAPVEYLLTAEAHDLLALLGK